MDTHDGLLLARRITTLMVFKLLLCLSSPNFPTGLAVLFFYAKQLLKVKFVVYYVMTKIGGNE